MTKELIVKITGEVVESNLPEYKKQIIAMIGAINTDLQTDNDFALAKTDAKDCRLAAKKVDALRSAALSQTVEINELLNGLDEIKETLNAKGLEIEKLVKTWETEKKADIIAGGIAKLRTQMADVDAHYIAVKSFQFNNDSFKLAIKGKRTIASMQKTVDKTISDILARFKVHCSLVDTNADFLAGYKTEYPSLFVDEDRLLVMDYVALMDTIHARIATHKAQEEVIKEKAKARELAIELETEKAAKLVTEIDPEYEPKEEQLAITMDEIKELHDVSRPVDSEQPKQDSGFNSYVLTINISSSRETAIEIQDIVYDCLKAYDANIVSVDIGKR